MSHDRSGRYPVAYIYALSDPHTRNRHYVGNTGDIAARMRSHKSYAKTAINSANTNRLLCLWLEELRELRLDPVIEILETVAWEDRYRVETVWKHRLRKAGEPLFNDPYAWDEYNATYHYDTVIKAPGDSSPPTA